MHYYEVLVAESRYHSDKPLTYSSNQSLGPLTAVTVALRGRNATGFVMAKTSKPTFAVKPIKTILSPTPLPGYCVELARWMADYYRCSLSEALRQFAPALPSVKRQIEIDSLKAPSGQLEIKSALTADQKAAINQIAKIPTTTVLLHGETGSGKTRVYLELAAKTLASGKSCIVLTPEISLTTQLAGAAKQFLHCPVYVIHSQLGSAERKKLWFKVLEAKEPIVVIGPRSALFIPVAKLGLIVVDEFHEPAYKQDNSPRYYTPRVASRLGSLAGAKVILGSATPPIGDYYLADSKKAIVRMVNQAISGQEAKSNYKVVDIKDRSNFTINPYLSNTLIDEINTTLSAKKQVMLYLNRRGSARLILCTICGWQLLCPNCDIPLIYHGDEHQARCHSCGYKTQPPTDCPVCHNPDIQYKSAGTKTIVDSIAKLFPHSKLRRFDSDNLVGERLNDDYHNILSGEVDILIGTQLLAKGLDLPKLGLVGIIAAETSLALPDYSAEERSFQLLYQIMGRVNRGHTSGQVVIQAYNPGSLVIQTAGDRDWTNFYKHLLAERQQFNFPPFSYLMRLECRKNTLSGAQKAAERLKDNLLDKGLPVKIMGPAPSFYGRRGSSFSYQIVVKARQRAHLLELSYAVPADWKVDLDPISLL